MPDSDAAEGRPLLEIEIIQLSNLFGSDIAQRNIADVYALISRDCDQNVANELEGLDIYRLSREKRHEVFIVSAYRAFLQRDPTKAELSTRREMLGQMQDGYRRLIDELSAERDDRVRLRNESRAESLRLTLADIDRWDRVKTLAWWK